MPKSGAAAGQFARFIPARPLFGRFEPFKKKSRQGVGIFTGFRGGSQPPCDGFGRGAPPLQSKAAGGSPQPAAPIGAGRRRKVGNAEKPAAPKSRKCRTAGRRRPAASNGRRRRMTGRNRMTGRGPRTDMVVAPDKGSRRTAGRGRKAGGAEKPAAPKSRKRTDGWSRRTAGRARKAGGAGCRAAPDGRRRRMAGRAGWLAAPDGWRRTGYRKSINS